MPKTARCYPRSTPAGRAHQRERRYWLLRYLETALKVGFPIHEDDWRRGEFALGGAVTLETVRKGLATDV